MKPVTQLAIAEG